MAVPQPSPSRRTPPRRHVARAALPLVLSLVAGPLTAGWAAAEDDPRTMLSPRLLPAVPGAVSRPEGWPRDSRPEDGTASEAPAADAARSALAGSVDKDRHVLSSIRAVPGAPLDSEGAAPAGVVPVAHEEAVSLDAAMIVARVGPEVVLESDLLTPKALEWLESVSPGLKPEQVKELRQQICRQVLEQHVETLLVYVDACREIPPDKLPEVRKSVDKAFDEQMLPQLLKEAGVANSLEYEQSLRARGQSLDNMRKMFFERGLAQEWLRKNARAEEEIPHADMIAWYQNHLDDYDYPARARFEAMTVKTGLKRSKREAWDLLAAMGNEVMEGRPFDDVARARSEGPTAANGGRFDWTNQGSLASKLLDEAVFTLPVGQLSRILEEDTALHIIRVVEREPAGRTSFLDAQTDIREELKQTRRRKQMEDYLTRLRDRTPVWTVFDDEAGGAAARTAARPTTRR
jgi:parvulin-like peptidyl-prolyl isomerase